MGRFDAKLICAEVRCLSGVTIRDVGKHGSPINRCRTFAQAEVDLVRLHDTRRGIEVRSLPFPEYAEVNFTALPILSRCLGVFLQGAKLSGYQRLVVFCRRAECR